MKFQNYFFIQMEWRTVELRDENGEGFETIQCEDMVFPKQYIRIQPEVRMKAIRDLQYRDGDVLICSYPKTGTHWVFNLVHFLMIPGPVDQMLTVSPKLLDLHPLEEIENMTSPRVFISHLKSNRLPVDHLQKRGKIILVTRNPRDTMVSHMYHTQRHEVFNYSKLTWNCFFDNWIKGQIPTGCYFDYYNSWQKALAEQKDLNVLIVHYENIIKDGIGELKKIQQFLGVENSEERLNQILDRCSWQRLKVDVDTGKPQPSSEEAQKRTRKGVIGHWRSRFTVAQDEIFNKVMEEEFKDSLFNISV